MKTAPKIKTTPITRMMHKRKKKVDLKNQDDPKREDNPKKEDDPKNEETLKKDVFLLTTTSRHNDKRKGRERYTGVWNMVCDTPTQIGYFKA